MFTLRFENESEFGSWFCFLHFGAHLAANLHRDRTLADVVCEAKLDALLNTISDVDPTQQTPAGTHLRQLKNREGDSIQIDGDTLALIDRFIRYAVVKSAPDWAGAAAQALEVVRRAHGPSHSMT
jgi:hypothetical protein